MKQLPLAMRLRERALFDNFVVGPNAGSVEQLRAALKEPGTRGAPNRVYWLDGPAGVGKSHLLQASCTLALSRGHSALYLPLSQVASFGPAALEGWSDAQLLALDELDVVIGQRDWEQALFGLYLNAGERDATLLAAGRAAPGLLPFVVPDLASRFAAAMRLSLQPLDEVGQREALRLRARARGLELPEDAARYLQRHFRRDLATLCKLLDAIDGASLQAQRRLTVPFIREVLAPARPRPAE